MKITKKDHLNKTGVIKWVDACGHTGETLKRVITSGFPIKETTGKLCFIGYLNTPYGKMKGVIIQTETDVGEDSGDYTLVPYAWVVDFKEFNNG